MSSNDMHGTHETDGMVANKPPNNTPYVWAVVIMSLIGVIAVLGITQMRPGMDNTTLITMVLGFLLPTTLSLLALMKVDQTDKTVNSRMGQLLDMIKKSAFAEGVVEGGRSKAIPVPPMILAPAILAPVTTPANVIRSGDPVTIKKD